MKKQLWTALAVLPLAALCAAETAKANGPAAAPAANAAAQAKAGWQGDSVVAGNKKAVFGKNGIITVWTGGRAVLEIYPYFSVRTPEKKTYWAGPRNRSFKITAGNDGKSATISGDLTIEGKTWRAFTEKAELTPEGSIHVTLNWQNPPQELNWKFNAALGMSGSYETLGGSLFKINQDSLTLPATHDPEIKKTGLGEFWRGKDFRATFLADRPADSFVFYGAKANNIQGIWVFRNKLSRSLNFWSYPDLKKSGLQFDIDIRGTK